MEGGGFSLHVVPTVVVLPLFLPLRVFTHPSCAPGTNWQDNGMGIGWIAHPLFLRVLFSRVRFEKTHCPSCPPRFIVGHMHLLCTRDCISNARRAIDWQSFQLLRANHRLLLLLIGGFFPPILPLVSILPYFLYRSKKSSIEPISSQSSFIIIINRQIFPANSSSRIFFIEVKNP